MRIRRKVLPGKEDDVMLAQRGAQRRVAGVVELLEIDAEELGAQGTGDRPYAQAPVRIKRCHGT